MSRSAGYSIAALRSRARPLDRWPISPSAGASIASPPSTAHSDCRQPRCARRRCPLAEHQPTPISSHAVRCRFAPSETTAAPSGRGIQRRAKYSPGKASMTVSPPAAAAGPLWEAPAVGSVTSSSIKVMTQASSPNASDSSGSLSPRAAGAVALAADQLSGSAPVSSNGRYRKGFGCRPRSTRVHGACRGENGHIRLSAKEVLARLRRIKPVTVS